MRVDVHLPNQTLELLPDERQAHGTLAALLRRHNVPLNTRCGERGLCAGCLAELVHGQVRLADGSVIEATSPAKAIRTCQAVPLGDVTLRVPKRSLLDYEPQVLTDYRLSVGLASDPLVTSGYGIAVDIGTTTVVAQLVRPTTGEVLAQQAEFNGQIHLGDDVLTRINLCSTDKAMIPALHQAVVKTLNELTKAVCDSGGVEPSEVAAYTLSGNTTMLHLLAGVDPTPLGFTPFTPVFLDHQVRKGSDLGLLASDADAHLLPGGAAYVGADIMSGAFASGLMYDEGPSLLVDIGTNGEIVLKRGEHALGCATAAGPAFEGSGLSCGMRAGRGAVSHVWMHDDRVSHEVIGATNPVGICGSAYLDVLAEGRKSGLLNPRGRLVPTVLADHQLEVDGVRAVRVAEGRGERPIVVTEFDLASLLQAKAAIAAGIETLLNRVGQKARDVRRLYLAGGFGMHLNLGNAIAAGMLPGFDVDQIVPVGNTSLAGAYAGLVDKTALEEMQRFAHDLETVELNLDPGFEDAYIDHLSLE